MSLETLMLKDADILRRARESVPRDENGYFTEEALDAELDKLITVDVGRVRKDARKRILRAAQRPGTTEPDGVLAPSFPGFGDIAPVDYYPNMLVKNDRGQFIEQDKSPLETERAKEARELENLNRVKATYNRTVATNQAYASWAGQQLMEGRDPHEIVFGNFVRETGIWQPAASDVKLKAAE